LPVYRRFGSEAGWCEKSTTAASDRQPNMIECLRILVVPMLLPLLVLAACDGPPDTNPHLPSADPVRGRKLAVSKGCAACHTFPDVRWPRGGLGPPLAGFADQGLIAGRLPNRPGDLIRFIRDAPAFVPEGAMPAMPMSDEDARDVAAYLLTLRSE
jgi:mono/diheme cytochrome c family protein